MGVTACSRIQCRATYSLRNSTVLGMNTDDTSSAFLASKPILGTERKTLEMETKRIKNLHYKVQGTLGLFVKRRLTPLTVAFNTPYRWL